MKSPIGSLFVVALAGCSAGLSAAPGTTGEISECQADDLATGQVVFFGLSNNLGPGTIMKRYPERRIGPEYLVGSIIADQPSTVVHHGVDWTCALGDSVARAFNANSAVGILPVDAALNAKLGRASHLGVTVDSVRWDDLLAGPYRAAVDHLSDPRLKADLLRGGYLVESRALVAKGIRVTALFERSIGASVKAALGEGTKSLEQGKVTAIVILTWDGTTELTITAPSEVYIAGQVRRFGAGRSQPADGTPEATAPLGQILIRTGG
jgi:hypothetical protein